jgi:predicted enzyme related to lactoylglutathione lyase
LGYVNVLASLQVSDFEATIEWYERLFGRGPDRYPMDGCVEWQLTPTGGVQIFRNPEGATAATIIVGLDDLEREASELRRRGIEPEPYNVPSGQFRLAELQDPSGNRVVLAQNLS